MRLVEFAHGSGSSWLRPWNDYVPMVSASTVVDLDVGYFGASTGAAAGRRAGAHRSCAVVSRGGGVGLPADSLGDARATTMFVGGGTNRPVLEISREVTADRTGDHELSILVGPGHVFDAPTYSKP